MFARLLLVVLAGCTAAAADTPTPGRFDRGYPEGAIGPTCGIRVAVVPKISGPNLDLRIELVNQTRTARTVTLEAPCPGSVASIEGLPSGFDPMHTCRMAPRCSGSTQTRTVTLPASGKPVAIATTRLFGKGDACNPPLPLGSLILHAEAKGDPGDVCAGTPVHVVRAKSGALRLAKLDDPIVPAKATPKPVPPPPPPKVKPAPKRVAPAPKRPCPACAFACLNGGVPSNRTTESGCPVCACDPPGIDRLTP